ncbi:hypothetical protein [Caballeronia sp. HLA56]
MTTTLIRNAAAIMTGGVANEPARLAARIAITPFVSVEQLPNFQLQV